MPAGYVFPVTYIVVEILVADVKNNTAGVSPFVVLLNYILVVPCLTVNHKTP
jgi:hypothetical protein